MDSPISLWTKRANPGSSSLNDIRESNNGHNSSMAVTVVLKWLRMTVCLFLKQGHTCSQASLTLLCNRGWLWTLDLLVFSSQMLGLQTCPHHFYVLLGIKHILGKHSAPWAPAQKKTLWTQHMDWIRHKPSNPGPFFLLLSCTLICQEALSRNRGFSFPETSPWGKSACCCLLALPPEFLQQMVIGCLPLTRHQVAHQSPKAAQVPIHCGSQS